MLHESLPGPSHSFQYTSISQGSIRILLLLPGLPGDALRGQLQHHPVDELPKYHAISYAWGNPVFESALELDDGSLAITESLEGALRQFRNEEHATMFWADQVCIDQQNMSERSQQVVLMSEVYSQAENVLVWLGMDGPGDRIAFRAVASILNRIPGESLLHLRSRIAKDVHAIVGQQCLDKTARLPKTDAMNDTELFEFAAGTLSQLLERAYFGRLWPVQEIILARTASHDVYAGAWPNITFHCGELSATFADISLCLATFEHTIFNQQARPRKPWVFSKSWCHSRVLKTALLTMVDAYELQTAVVHDRLYAIRNLTTDGLSEMLTPDYALPPEELWRRTALCSLRPRCDKDSSPCHVHIYHHKSILLALAGISRANGDVLPWSWVSDMSRLTQKHLNKSRQYEMAKFQAGSPAETSRKQSSFFCDPKFPDVIQAMAGVVARVDGVLTNSSLETEDISSMVSCYLTCRQFVCERSGPSSKSLQNFRSFFQQGQRPANSTVATGTLRSEHNDLAISQHRLATGDKVDASTVYNDLATYTTFDSDALSQQPSFDDTHILAHFDDGRFGWIPHTATKDDVAVILHDAPFPFIFRENDDGTFTNKGDCYIHGAMHGEAWPLSKNGRSSEGIMKPVKIR
ncbi:uncharacterized protein RCC_07887 [Ramularia collo-cygni]|uniref:Heterokaryon incompatibility domain-containing protein n=1 Tax=Ramularia collo-cygni TaxID=112498 RepID=A0A2D3V2H1_9PEZI|nr:uncharacterized protein RCC_07887 [Ramularia collo-cygni]CZT22018.1 uncharacterized protein RCC_07887 [Ramularia collo-cygni]